MRAFLLLLLLLAISGCRKKTPAEEMEADLAKPGHSLFWSHFQGIVHDIEDANPDELTQALGRRQLRDASNAIAAWEYGLPSPFERQLEENIVGKTVRQWQALAHEKICRRLTWEFPVLVEGWQEGTWTDPDIRGFLTDCSDTATIEAWDAALARAREERRTGVVVRASDGQNCLDPQILRALLEGFRKRCGNLKLFYASPEAVNRNDLGRVLVEFVVKCRGKDYVPKSFVTESLELSLKIVTKDGRSSWDGERELPIDLGPAPKEVTVNRDSGGSEEEQGRMKTAATHVSKWLEELSELSVGNR